MAVQPQRSISEEEYLALERESETKSEFLNGEIFAMAGASPEHVLITTNMVAALHAFLKGGQWKGGHCRVFASDQRLRIEATGLNTYPDVAVVCGELRFSDDRKDTIVNPQLIVEVLSESTRDYDRGGKFMSYRTIESLVDYLLIDQYKVHVEYFSRQSDGRWILEETDDRSGNILLKSIDFTLELADIYYGIDHAP